MPAPAAKPPAGRRLQRSRRRNTRTPPGAYYGGRPGLLANPFDSGRFGHARSVKLHARWIEGRLGALTLERLGFDPVEIDALSRLRKRVLDFLPRLVGRDIECWCPLTSRWCHVITLLALIARLTGATIDPDSAAA